MQFFPVNKAMLARYAEIMNSAIAELDVLASWRPKERFYKHELKGRRKISLGAFGGRSFLKHLGLKS